MAAARPGDPLLWLRMGECCMSAAAAQAPDTGGCAEAVADGGGDAAELLEQAAQCLANALALSSACDGPPGKALAGPGRGPAQAAGGGGGRDGGVPGVQEGFASGSHQRDERGSAAVAGQPGSAPDAGTGGAAAAGSSAAAAAPPEAGSAAGGATGAPHAAGKVLHTGAEEATAANEPPAHAEGGRWQQAGVVRLAAQGASSWVALRRGDPRGALEHGQALLQVGPSGVCGASILCRMSWRLLRCTCSDGRRKPR